MGGGHAQAYTSLLVAALLLQKSLLPLLLDQLHLLLLRNLLLHLRTTPQIPTGV